MGRITNLLQAYATLLVFELLGEVQVLLVNSLHNVWLEYRLKYLKLTEMLSVLLIDRVVDEKLEDCSDLFMCCIFLK